MNFMMNQSNSEMIIQIINNGKVNMKILKNKNLKFYEYRQINFY